jgi:hypothetical protein
MVRVTVVEEQAGAPEREARLALIAVAAIADGTLLGDEEACEEELDELFRRDVLITEQREPGLFVACLADAGREFIRAALATPARPEGPSTEAAVEAGITALVEGGWANREFHPLETRKAVRAVLMAASGGARPGVTDEAVEKGARALWAEGGGSGPWDKQTTNTQEYYRKLSRGFLEAVGQGPDEAER